MRTGRVYGDVRRPRGRALAARVRVRLEVQLAPPPVGHVRVQLGRREIGVAEHLLHGAEIGAAFEQVRRERVAQEVRMDAARLESRLLGELAQDEEDAGPRERPAARVEEELHPRLALEMRAAVREVAAQRVDRGTADRDDAFLVPLADAADEAVLEVDGVLVEPGRLAHAQAAAVEELDERAVAHRERRRSRRRRRAAARPRRAKACAGARGGASAARPAPRDCRPALRRAPGGGRRSGSRRGGGRSSSRPCRRRGAARRTRRDRRRSRSPASARATPRRARDRAGTPRRCAARAAQPRARGTSRRPCPPTFVLRDLAGRRLPGTPSRAARAARKRRRGRAGRGSARRRS